MGRMLVWQQRRILRRWVKWVPVLAIPFAVLFTHAWLNVQILRADYVLRELDRESESLREQLHHAGVVQSVQQDPEILAAQASELAFVQPKPGQQVVITFDPANPLGMPEDSAFALARRDTASREDAGPPPASEAGVPAPTPEPLVAPESPAPPPEPVAPARTDESGQDLSATPQSDAGVWIGVDDAASEVFTVPDGAAEEAPVVLDLPEDAYVEEIIEGEVAMGSPEVL